MLKNLLLTFFILINQMFNPVTFLMFMHMTFAICFLALSNSSAFLSKIVNSIFKSSFGYNS